MRVNMTSRTVALRMLLSFFLITAVLFLMFMSDGRSTAEFTSFLKFFAPLSAVLLGTFIITYAILERKTNFHLRTLIAGIISYVTTLGAINFLYGLDLQDAMLGIPWVALTGATSIYERIRNE